LYNWGLGIGDWGLGGGGWGPTPQPPTPKPQTPHPTPPIKKKKLIIIKKKKKNIFVYGVLVLGFVFLGFGVGPQPPTPKPPIPNPQSPIPIFDYIFKIKLYLLYKLINCYNIMINLYYLISIQTNDFIFNYF